ncbi:acetyltransferase [Lunatimonas salinarum]|uniref:acetyltransferase n=1 Tax=Lunatimonas salinarum TaxID=1774590 RepID=UPI001ADF2EAD|nr:acetyltransferase [Lunatimonas salinarum]
MYVYGASGHGRVIIDMIDSYAQIDGVFDDDPAKKEVLGYPVLGPVPPDFEFSSELFIAIGDNRVRKGIRERLHTRATFATILHESAILSKRAHLEPGTVVMEGAIVKVGCMLGEQVIVNTGASIDHDCHIGDYVHVAPQATLCGGIELGVDSLIGANAIILPGIKIGAWCTIGAGSIVHQDVPDHSTWIGNRLQSAR